MKNIIAFLLISFPFALFADGWDLLKQNKFLEARTSFEHVLKNDSINKEALEGMIVLTEIAQDPHFYELYVTRYFRHYDDGFAFETLDNAYNGTEETIYKKELPSRFKMTPGLDKAIAFSSTTNNRQDVLKEYRKFHNKFNWSLIGPFKNVSGSGHIEQYPPETVSFDLNQMHIDETGDTLGWVAPKHMAGTGRVFINQHLSSPNYGGLGVYYINTYINIPESKTFTVDLSRSAAIKWWVDDHLIFEQENIISYENTGEQVEITLDKGWHRMLIKLSGGSVFSDGYDLLSFYDWKSVQQTKFAMRFINQNDETELNISSSAEPQALAENQNKRPSFKVLKSTSIDYWSQLESPTYFQQFLLCKAYIKATQYQAGEKAFYLKLKQYPNSTFHKYLLSKLYAKNGKIEKVYKLLGQTEKSINPIYEMEYEKLKEIDLSNEKVKYKETLDYLKSISRSNFSLIKKYIKYFDKYALTAEKDKFIDKTIELYPEYKSKIESDKSTYKKDNDRWSPKDDIKSQKSSIARLRKGENWDRDYQQAIEYYKDKKKPVKVLMYYDMLISQNKHITTHYLDKAEYLIEEDLYKEAAVMIRQANQLHPYNAYGWELLGDTYEKRNKKDSALRLYKKALSLKKSSYWTSSLNKKIEKIEGTSKYKRIFKTKNFEDVLAEPGWQQMTRDEDAIILMYTKDMVVTEYDQVEMYQNFMVKLLTDAGIERWREFNFRFMGKMTSVKVVKPNGTETFPDKSRGMVVFKDLQKGDLIKIEGKSEYSLGGVFDNEFTTSHFVYFPDPIYYTKFELAMPPHRNINVKLHKLQNTMKRTNEEDGFSHYTWEHNRLGRIQFEDAFPDYYDLYRSIQVSTMDDWSKMVKWYQRKTYRKLEPTYDVLEILDTIITPQMSDEEKVIAVYNYITKEIRYSYVAFLNSRFTPKRPTNTCSAGIGDCKDVATLMIVMLRALDIKSDYCLVKTNHYNHLDVPPSMTFDHVIVAYDIDGETKYADLTTNYYPYKVLPKMDCNAVGLLIKDDEDQVLRLPNDFLDKDKSKVVMNTTVNLRTDRGADIKVNGSYTGVPGATLRETLFRTPPTKYKDLILESLGVGVFENLEVKNFDFENVEEFSEPLQATYSLSTKGYMDKVINLFILRMPYMTGVQKSQAISSEFRTNRLDISKIMYIEPTTEIVTINLPQGYRLIELPDNINVTSKFGSYSVQFSKVENGFKVVKKQQFNQKIISIADFQAFKSFYLNLLDEDKVKIAIQKK